MVAPSLVIDFLSTFPLTGFHIYIFIFSAHLFLVIHSTKIGRLSELDNQITPGFHFCTFHHHVVPPARISLTLYHHFSWSLIASGRSSGLHPVSSQSCCMYVRAGHPAFARPYVGVHSSISLMSSSLLLQQCPACLVRLALVLCGVLPPGLIQYCSQHSCVIAV